MQQASPAAETPVDQRVDGPGVSHFAAENWMVMSVNYRLAPESACCLTGNSPMPQSGR